MKIFLSGKMYVICVVFVMASQVFSRNTRRTSTVQQESKHSQDANMLRALSVLLSETGLANTRRGRQLGAESLAGFQQEEVCEQTGFEIRKREECNEVVETECRPIEVAKIRTEIVNKCKTKSEESCNITMREVPRQECTPTQDKRQVAIGVKEKQVTRVDIIMYSYTPFINCAHCIV